MRTLLRRKQKLLEILVGGEQQFLCRPLEIYFAVPQHHDVGWRSVRACAVSAEARDMPCRLIETEIREAEGVLDAVRGHQRCYFLQIPAAENQGNDRLRSDGIEPGSRRIVKNERRTV